MAPNTHQYHVTLTDGTYTVGLMLRSASAIRRLPRGTGVERKSARQQNWTGGRGQERLSSDATKFFDVDGCWTTQPGHLISGPMTKDGYGQRSGLNYFPGDTDNEDTVNLALSGSTLIARSFTTPAGMSTFTAKTRSVLVQLSPATGTALNGTAFPLYVQLWSDVAGAPGAILAGVNVTTTRPNDLLTFELEETWSDTPSLAASTTYWIVVRQGITANPFDTWSVNCSYGTNVGKTSTDGTTWSNSNYAPYFRILDTPADTAQDWYFFEYKQALYVMRSGVTTGKLYLNGDRGVVTGGGSSTVMLSDSTKSWTADEWKNCTVLIFSGSVCVGEERTITTNTATTLTVSPAFSATPVVGAPGTGCEYVIKGSRKWTERTIGATAMPPASSTPVVCGDTIYIPYGDARRYSKFNEYNNAGVWTTRYADDYDLKANYFLACLDANGALAIIRLRNADPSDGYKNTWARSTWTDYSTNLAFGAFKSIGDTAGWIQDACIYDGKIYVGKTDGLWILQSDDQCVRVNVEMHPARQFGNCRNMLGWNTYLYFPVLNGWERLYGTVIDDIGPNRDTGMPAGRQGRVTDFCPILGHGYIAHDAGESGKSAVMLTLSPGGSWHELYRGPTGRRIRSVFYHRCDSFGVLWFGCGDDLKMIRLPADVHNANNDSNMRYRYESALVTSWIDFAAPGLPNFFDILRIYSTNLSAAGTYPRKVSIDYQYTDGVVSSGWIKADADISSSDYQTLSLNIAARKVRLRFRMATGDADTPVIIKDVEVRGHTINECVYDFTLDLNLADQIALFYGMESTETATDVLTRLEYWSQHSIPVTLGSKIGQFNGFVGHIDPVSVVPTTWNPDDPSDVRLVGNIMFKSIAGTLSTAGGWHGDGG